MGEDKYLTEGKEVFRTICSRFDRMGWNVDKNEQELVISCSARGDDLPIELRIEIDTMRGLFMVISPISFTIQEDKRLDTAVAVCAINDILVHGCLDYNINRGRIFYRMVNSFIDSTIGEELAEYMVICACRTVDEYNDKLLMLSKGRMTLEQFLTSIREE